MALPSFSDTVTSKLQDAASGINPLDVMATAQSISQQASSMAGEKEEKQD